jgi:pSer/pThr/pTyr-binding forkhead associated (FHA) protein
VLLRFRIRPPAQAGGLAAVERIVDVECPGPDVDVTLGRRMGVAIQLPFGTVSAVHARIAGAPGHWTVEDLGSANGTYREGQRADAAAREPRLAAGEAHPIRDGEVIRLADVAVVFEGVAASLARGPEVVTETTATLARRLVSDFFGACRPAEVARLVVDEGPEAGQSLVLTTAGRPYRVGRAAGCDLVLTDDDVSREHVSFERSWDGVQVRDLGSKNGIELDGRRLPSVSVHRLHDGEVVALGNTRIRLDDPEDRYLRAMQEEDGRRTEVAEPDKPPERRPPGKSSPPGWGPSVRTAGGPVLIAAIALLVLAGVGILVAWFLLGDWG